STVIDGLLSAGIGIPAVVDGRRCAIDRHRAIIARAIDHRTSNILISSETAEIRAIEDGIADDGGPDHRTVAHIDSVHSLHIMRVGAQALVQWIFEADLFGYIHQ